MNPFRAPVSGQSDPPKFLAQFASQALERFGTGLFPDGVSPIQKTVVTICKCHGYFSLSSNGLDSRSLGLTLKRTLSRSFIAFSVNRAALSVAVCAKSVQAPVETKQINVKDNPLPVIKAPTYRRTRYRCQRRKSTQIRLRLRVNVKNEADNHPVQPSNA